MPNITLPDGSQRNYSQPVTAMQVAEDIGPGLARATLAAEVDGKLVDTSYLITEDAQVSIITTKDTAGLEVLRHSCAHLLAQAVKQLFPTAQVTIGPVIEDGFYYDFSYETPFTPEDIEKIEQRMHALAKQDIAITRSEISREEAIKFFRDMGEEYKAKIIEDIPTEETLSLYQQGDFIDLCRGPHVPSTGKLKAFKLTKVSGAYWKGDANNEMLQRIYGTCWANKEDLQAYLTRLEEAEKRDHRKIGKQLDLFHLQEEAPGMVFWHPNGWSIYQTLEQYMRKKFKDHGYQEIRTPQVVDRSLWERSGHWDKFSEEMFTVSSEHHEYAIKPMNCPCHIQVFNQGLKSYRDLPLRLAEFGVCHRNEPSGALHGLMRVRSMVQDDAHIFCEASQLKQEVINFNKMLREVYADFGFEDIIVLLATRPERRIGTDAQWDKAEADLAAALDETGLEWQASPGEGAFYGPKIEYSLKDSIGRIWQLGTMQLDYFLPERLGAQYVAEDGSRQVPVMLHRATFGSLERFIGILIEHYAGKFPLWLAPIQAIVCNITSEQAPYAQNIQELLKNRGFRVKTDLRNEKIGFKIREHTLQRIPYLFIVGKREVAENTVTVRTQEGTDLGSFSVEELIHRMHTETSQRSRLVET
jgi:threonyl-tRNA synthetase